MITFLNHYLHNYMNLFFLYIIFFYLNVFVYLSIDKIYEKSGINITSISFEESAYNGMLNYTITLNSSTMTGNVINPVNQYNFTENKDKTISLSRSLSAQGINTAKYPSKSNALENAITFVTQNTGLATMPTVKFISGDIGNFYLQNMGNNI